MEGSSGGCADQDAMQVDVKRESFWDLHKSYVSKRANGKQELMHFRDTLKRVFQLAEVPDDKTLSQAYCSIFTDSFMRVFPEMFQSLPLKGRLTQIGARMMSGLVIRKLASDHDVNYVVVCYQEVANEGILQVIKHDPFKHISDAQLSAGHKFKAIPLKSLRGLTAKYKLVSFKERSKFMTIGDQPTLEPAQTRVSLRHKSVKKGPRKTPRAEHGSSASDAEPDLEQCREDMESLLDTPLEQTRTPVRKKKISEISAGGDESTATGGPALSEPPGAKREQQPSDKDKHVLQMVQDWNVSFVVDNMSPEDAKALYSELRKRHKTGQIDGVLPKDASEKQHTVVEKELKMERKSYRRAYALNKTLVVDERNWALDTGFDQYLAATYTFSEENIKQPDGQVCRQTNRHKNVLPRKRSEYEHNPVSEYRDLCFRNPDPEKSRTLALVMKHSVTGHWSEFFPEFQQPDQEMRVAVLVDENVYRQMDLKTKGLFVLEPADKKAHGISYFRFDEVIETPEPMDDATMTALCTGSTAELYQLCDREIRKRLKWKMNEDEGSLHEYIEDRLLAVVTSVYLEHNDKVEAAQAKRRQNDEKLKRILEYNQEHPDSPRKVPTVSLDERLNGRKELQVVKIPEKINVMLVPFPFMMVCANNMRLEHGPHCRCCGSRIRNPITGPLYEDVVHQCSVSSFRRLKSTIPRYFIGGLCSCFPLCNTYKTPY